VIKCIFNIERKQRLLSIMTFYGVAMAVSTLEKCEAIQIAVEN